MPKPTLREYFKNHPRLASQWSERNLSSMLDKTIGSPAKAWWYCPTYNCHYEKVIHSKIKSPDSCSVCNGSTVFPGFNDLQTMRPDLAREWSPENKITPSEVKFTSIKAVKWVCSKSNSHAWTARISHRTHANSGCPKCAAIERRKQAKVRVLDINDTMKKSFKSAPNGETNPSRVSVIKCEWKCEKGHTWAVAPVRYKGCPFCKGTKVEIAGKILNVPEKAIDDFPRAKKLYSKDNQLPSHLVSYNSAQICNWKCAKGHSWIAPVHSVVNGVRKGRQCCPHCTNQISVPETQLQSFISSIVTTPITTGDRKTLKGREIDILIPAMNIGIEFNGGFWHSSFKIDKQYHYQKWRDCLTEGVELITIWEDDWSEKQDQIKHMLRCRLSSSSDLPPITHIQETTKEEALSFASHYNVNAFPETATAFFTAISRGNIVATLVIEENDTSAKITHQSFKYPHEHGLKELIEFLSEKYQREGTTSIQAVTDNGSPDQNVYIKQGFIREEQAEPCMYYLYQNKRISKEKLEHILLSNPNFTYDPATDSLPEAAQANKLYEVWDSGRTTWTLNLA